MVQNSTPIHEAAHHMPSKASYDHGSRQTDPHATAFKELVDLIQRGSALSMQIAKREIPLADAMGKTQEILGMMISDSVKYADSKANKKLIICAWNLHGRLTEIEALSLKYEVDKLLLSETLLPEKKNDYIAGYKTYHSNSSRGIAVVARESLQHFGIPIGVEN
ncbi:hypothetical protein QAD02_018808 [Eretmocerus hayati]|uniref:Uncharacterized protein n=1 Tax=Eretmocerus hayati TaxID=131215 RepID=A0ACC2PHU2_9HYME|nr:hypothetical protein QAD02_018808 [Eretmocerus hayati]